MKRTMIWILLVVCGQIVYGQDFFNKGKVALSSRDTAAAIQAFQSSLKANQKTAESNYYLGAIAFARHNMQDASNYLQASVKQNDENVDALDLLAKVYVGQKNTSEALSTYRKAVKLAPKNVSVATGFGLALLGADSVDAAIIQLTKAKDLDGNNPEVYMALGDAYMKQGVAVLATGNYQKAIDLAPKNMGYRFKLAQTFEKNRQYTDALAQYDSIATIDTTNVDALLEAGRILSKASGNQKKLAIKPLYNYTQKRPKSLEGATLLTNVLYKVENYPEAAKAARHTLDIDSSSADIWRIYAFSLTQMKPPDYKTALYAYEKLKKMKQFKPEDWGPYGNALVAAGRGQEAKSLFLDFVALNKKSMDSTKADSANCDVYFNLASLYMAPPAASKDKPNYDSASYYFEKKIACDPKSLSSYVNGAASYMQIKNMGRARELLTKALELKPDFMQGRLWYARYLAQVDSLEEAIGQYDLVLKDISGDPVKYKRELGEISKMKAALNFQRGRYTTVVKDLKDALAIGVDDAGLRLTLGQAILQTLDKEASSEENSKKIEESIADFRKSVTMDGTNAQAHLWLGQGLVMSRKEGDDARNKQLVEEACSEFRKALKIDPKLQDAKKAMERIGC